MFPPGVFARHTVGRNCRGILTVDIDFSAPTSSPQDEWPPRRTAHAGTQQCAAASKCSPPAIAREGTLYAGFVDQRISLITLAVADVSRSRSFYVSGLGWKPELEAPGILMLRAGEHLIFSLWNESEFEQEVGPITGGPGVAPLTLAHNLGSKNEVDTVLRAAQAAGADPVSEAVERAWGGYSGYFGDPDGYRWEIAWAPGPVNDVVLPQ